MPTFEFQILLIFQNAVHTFVRRCWKSFTVSFTYIPKYWKSSTTSSDVPSSMISGVGSMLLDSNFILSTFISNPTSLATPDRASSCYSAFPVLFSSKTILLAYSISSIFFTGILLDCQLRVMKPILSMSAFLTTQLITAIKRYAAKISSCSTAVFTSDSSVTVLSIITAERVPSLNKCIGSGTQKCRKILNIILRSMESSTWSP